MARDGSGNYSLPTGNPVGTGTTISSTVHNATMTDIASALTASVSKDGQTTPTANLPMGGFKHTGVASGTARNHYASVAQLQDSDTKYVGSVAGTNSITGTLTPAITSYAVGMEVLLSPVNANTGAVTLALNGLSAKNVYKDNTSRPLVAGDLSVGGLYKLYYNGSSFFVDVVGSEGTFTATLTGCTTAPTATVVYSVTRNIVTLMVPDLTGTSNSGALTFTGLPSHLRPATASIAASVPVALDNSAPVFGVYAAIPFDSDTVNFYKSVSGTASGTKGLNRLTLTYSLV